MHHRRPGPERDQSPLRKGGAALSAATGRRRHTPGCEHARTGRIRDRRPDPATKKVGTHADNFPHRQSDTETHVSRGYSLGAVDYILAPVLPDVLRTKVSVFVELYKKTGQIKRQGERLREIEAEQFKRQLSETNG